MNRDKHGTEPWFSPDTKEPHRWSVIIPTYQAESTIGRCLLALQKAIPEDAEIIVVDDGSTDKTSQIVQSFPEVTFIPSHTNRGAAAARNRGIKAAKGKFLLFIDADVEVESDIFEALERAFKEYGEPEGVVGIFNSHTPYSNLCSRYKHHQQRLYHLASPRDTNALFTAVCAVKREVIVTVGMFDESIKGATTEDVELGRRLVSEGHRLILDHSLQVTHYKRYSLWSLLKTQFSRARSMAALFKQADGPAEVLHRKQFLSIPLRTGAVLPAGGLFILGALLTLTPWFTIGFGLMIFGWLCLIVLQWPLVKSMLKSDSILQSIGVFLLLPLDAAILFAGSMAGVLSPFQSAGTKKR